MNICCLCHKEILKGQPYGKLKAGFAHVACVEDIKKQKAELAMQGAKLQDQIDSVLSRDNFYKFCQYIDPEFYTDDKPHLKLIADAFQEVAEKKIRVLAVSMPPRAGKSYITSLFCAWMLGKHPSGSIMRNSYAAKLAEKFSKDIRDGILLNPKYQRVFPGIRVSATNSAVDGWSLEGNVQPSYFCAGVGGPITGYGCNLLAILDDPIKNIEEALSEITISNVWNWYTSTHMSRFETGCPEIHIATRWSKKDPIGRLTDPYSEEFDPNVKVIKISALDNNGQSFCEKVKTTEEYHKIQNITEDFIWQCEFMQEPIEEKGLLLPMSELNRFTMSEIKGRTFDAVIGYTDTADEGTDYLCSVIGRKKGEYTYITDVVYTQDPVEITEPLVAQMVIDTGADEMKIESNAGGKSFALNVDKLIKGKSYCQVEFEPTTQNKETRILMNAGYIKSYFYFRSDYQPGSEYDKFLRAVTSYVRLGKNKHDDANDAITGLAEYVKLLGGKVDKRKPPKGFYTEDELRDLGYNKYEIKQTIKVMQKPWEASNV